MATTKITQVGKRIVNDSSLIFYYDMTNKIRSFKGKPTTNLFAGAVNDYSSWDTNAVNFTDNVPLPEIKVTETTSNVGHYFQKNGISVVNGTTYTTSIYIKPVEVIYFQLTTSTGFGSSYVNFTLTGDGSLSGPLSSSAKIELIKTGRYTGWYRCSLTATSNDTNPNGKMGFALINSASATRLQSYVGTDNYGVLILDPQFEVSSFATPFVDGTRSNTQAIIDLTGNETVTANSLTYNSDDTFRFGNGQYITLPNAATTFGTGSVSTSVEFWIRPIDDTDTTRIPVGHQNVNM
jgi:hypothetical protein